MAANSNMHNLATLIKRYALCFLRSLLDHNIDHLIQASSSNTCKRQRGRLTEMDPIEKASQLIILSHRLEAATSRLEDMATSVDASHPETVAAINSASISQPEPTPTVAETAPRAPEPLPRSIEDFDKLIQEDVQGFVNASEKIGGLVEQQVRRDISSLQN